MYTNASTRFINSDQLGTDRVRTTASGAIDDTCTSMPFGDNQSCTGYGLGFAGYQNERETGLYYAHARYYSPSLGRPDAFTDTGRPGFCDRTAS